VMEQGARHAPVLVNEVIAALMPNDGKVYVDGTFGAGGYSRALLDAANCAVWGIDRDPLAQQLGAKLSEEFAGRLTVLGGRYGDMEGLLGPVGVSQIDGIALDLGISSMQVDDPDRGFSFAADGPLDMRMEQTGMTAADAVNQLAEGELADVIYRYGEERASRRIAKAIVKARGETKFTRTEQLAALVRRIVSRAKDGKDPATRTFQAIRIYVNDEVGELERGLLAAEKLLVPGGRLAVVSFHSLEDRIVKTFLRDRCGEAPRPSRHAPALGFETDTPTFRLVGRKAVKPSEAEVSVNPRARSARLRVAERTAAPHREAA